MGWNYAELSKVAKESGGPEKLVEILVKSGENKMVKWVVGAFVGGVALTTSTIKVIEHFKNKKAISPSAIDAAKSDLIQGIKNYDATQEINKNEGSVLMDKTRDKNALYDENVDYDSLKQNKYKDSPGHTFYTCPKCGGEYLATFIHNVDGETICIDF